ncbi:MAG: molybdopterin molybdotransferase MoeA [Nitrospiraceae bacterium]|nr:molybdopterin molybdotransferase MoeA [Nitrospiraceae bacterium]
MEIISYSEALQHVKNTLRPLGSESLQVLELAGRITCDDIFSLVDSPSSDISLKDGYAVRSSDIASASESNPVKLKLIGSLTAGGSDTLEIIPGTAVTITSGTSIPDGADAVISQEFASDNGKFVTSRNNAHPGRNILRKGTDVSMSELIIKKKTVLRPAHIGLIAASGHSSAKVYRNPDVIIIATGDEILPVGTPAVSGKVFASNLVTISGWCRIYGMKSESIIVEDSEKDIADAIKNSINRCDCLITIGGAWKGSKDFVVGILDNMGWQKFFHKVKMGPGKAVGFGLLDSKPVFCLPGGPPSNQMAFMQLVIPALMILAGHKRQGLAETTAVAGTDLTGQEDWTQFIHGTLSRPDHLIFNPLKMDSRLQFMAKTEALACIPKGISKIDKGSSIKIQIIPESFICYNNKNVSKI